MLGEHALKLRHVGTFGGHRDGDAPGAIGAQERVEIEVAGVVDDDGVVGTEEKAADEIERLRAGIRHDNLIEIGQHGALSQAHREQPPQRGIAERLVILAPAFRIFARGQAQRPLNPEIEHPGIR